MDKRTSWIRARVYIAGDRHMRRMDLSYFGLCTVCRRQMLNQPTGDDA